MNLRVSPDTPLLRLDEVIELTTLSKGVIYKLIAANNFPRPVQLSSRRVAWTAASIVEWLDKLDKPVGDEPPLPTNIGANGSASQNDSQRPAADE